MVYKKFNSAGSFALLCITFSALPAIAATERQLDSHEHGHAQINMAISGNEVLAELISPAANVVGFEHMPKSEEDEHVIEEAAETLAKGEQLFMFDAAAECSLITAEIESELLAEHHDDHDGEKHDHDDDNHDGEKHEHDDDHHDGDGRDDHDHEGHADEVHSEFHVTWSFNCAKPDQLGSVQVKLFESFSGFEEIDVSVAGESAQSSFELSPDQSEIRL